MKTVTPDITIYRGGLKYRGIVVAIILTMSASVSASTEYVSDSIATVKYCKHFAGSITSDNIDTKSKVFKLAAVQSAITKAEECMKLIEAIHNLRAKIQEKE